MLGEGAKYAFCGLKRKRRDFARSVLVYVSSKIPALTHSGRKRRVCVAAADGLTHAVWWKFRRVHPRRLGSFAGLAAWKEVAEGERDERERGGRKVEQKTKPLALGAARGFGAIVDSGLLSHMTLCSIIGDGELNFRVRNGIGCTLSSMAINEICQNIN